MTAWAAHAVWECARPVPLVVVSMQSSRRRMAKGERISRGFERRGGSSLVPGITLLYITCIPFSWSCSLLSCLWV